MEATSTETAQDEAPAPKTMPKMMTALAALVIGGAAGAFGVGPMLGPSSGGGEAKAESGGGGGGHGPAGGEAAGTTFKLDGVIINPAGSRGQHHLITTIAFEVDVQADEPRLRAAEVPLRDAVSALLERKTLEALTSPGIRDQLRVELRALAEPYLHDGSVKVYLPQYIVQ